MTEQATIIGSVRVNILLSGSHIQKKNHLLRIVSNGYVCLCVWEGGDMCVCVCGGGGVEGRGVWEGGGGGGGREVARVFNQFYGYGVRVLMVY